MDEHTEQWILDTFGGDDVAYGEDGTIYILQNGEVKYTISPKAAKQYEEENA